MKKIILILVLLFSFNSFAQVSVELKTGLNRYEDKGSVALPKDDVSFGIAYEHNNIYKPRIFFNIGQLVNLNEGYENNYYGIDLDLLINLKSALKLTYSYWRIYPYLGVGVSKYDIYDTFTINGGIVNSFKIDDHIYFGLEIGTKTIFGVDYALTSVDNIPSIKNNIANNTYLGFSLTLNFGRAYE